MTKRDERGVPASSVPAPWLQAMMIGQAGIGAGMRVMEIGSGGCGAAALLREIAGSRPGLTAGICAGQDALLALTITASQCG